MPILLSLLTLLKKIPYQVYVLVGVVLLLWLFGNWRFNQGAAYVQNMWDQDLARLGAVIEDLEKSSLTVNMIVDTEWKTRTEKVYVKGETIVKQIPVYIPADTPDLPAGFRVLHDAAVASEVPGTSSSVEATPVPVATATETIVENYTTCLVYRAEIDAWRSWYQEQSQLWQSASSK